MSIEIIVTLTVEYVRVLADSNCIVHFVLIQLDELCCISANGGIDAERHKHDCTCRQCELLCFFPCESRGGGGHNCDVVVDRVAQAEVRYARTPVANQGSENDLIDRVLAFNYPVDSAQIGVGDAHQSCQDKRDGTRPN